MRAGVASMSAGAATPQALELRHLRYFVALADAGSFTRAAEKIFIAQPTLSQQIRRLEEIVGTPLLQRRREGLRLTPAGRVLPAALEVMTVGEFEPQVWVPSTHPAASRGLISLEELAALPVVHGPRSAHPGTYDAWLAAMRGADPHFEFTDPPFRHSLAMILALTAAGSRPAAVLTGPAVAARVPARPIRPFRLAGTYGMVQVVLQHHPLIASAALVWRGDLPRPLQQLLFDTADSLAGTAHAPPADLISLTTA